MDLSGLRTAVRRRANVPSTDGIWTDAFVNEAINEALTSISLEHPWPWLESLVNASHTSGVVDLSAVSPAIRDISHVFVDDDECKKVSIADIDRYAQLAPQKVRYVYAVWGDDLTIRSTPPASETVQIRYLRDEPALSGDSDTPLMPAVYHPCIYHRAAAIGFEALDDQSSAAMHEARARHFVTQMEATALRKIRGPHSVRVRAGYPY